MDSRRCSCLGLESGCFAIRLYGPEIRKWIERGFDAEIAVYLIPARTDTRWFHELVIPKAAEIRFIKGRLKFGDAENAAPFPSMLVIFKKEHGS